MEDDVFREVRVIMVELESVTVGDELMDVPEIVTPREEIVS